MPPSRPALLDALALAAALKGAEPEDVRVVERGFLPIHEALARRELCDKAWALLERELPPLDASWSWDRCERLRRGVLAYLARRGGSLAAAMRDAPPETAAMIRRSAESTPAGRELLARG